MSQDFPKEVQLTLLLTGGQQYALPIQTDHPLLQQLFAVLLDRENKRARQLFQIPVYEGRAMLTFSCDRLVGIVTEPPLVLQEQPVAKPSVSSAVIPSAANDPLISHYLQVDNVLTPDEHQRLLDYVMEHEAEFVSTSTSTGAVDYRQSVVLYSFPEFADLLNQRIHALLPEVLTRLQLPTFSVSQVEAQLTAHNDGHFYKIHNDNGSPDTASRELTYVYYFYREPKPFSGGELLIYDSKVEDNFYKQADTFKTVEPRNNSIVFFRSRYMHEVLPVRCSTRAFPDSRFTINGWLRRE